ncbi:unnamed protein product [Adineta steineri]|uniref:Uncharacterized protein n=1 Tax=Adineta steineri TaxID=433720 RepID=A0A819FWE2_9BILA|nr:unnamed protein product [Adineta steineri]CAF3872105.1 unnamed protein product [Adineta steineri]
MAFQNREEIYTACVILVIVSGLYLMANVLPMWTTQLFVSGTDTFGLWKVCLKTKYIPACVNLPLSVDDKTMATRAFITICCILAPLSVISILSITLVNENLKKRMSLLAKVLVIACFISRIIGVPLGMTAVVDTIMNIDANIGVSCILAIVAFLLNFVGALITFMIE